MARLLGINSTPTANDELASKSYIESAGGGGGGALPIGSVVPYGGTTAPTGFLMCDGSAVSRTTYASLFSAISTTHGAGDGSTTFNLPDLRERHPLGRHPSGPGNTSTMGAVGGTFNHTHDVPSHSHTMANHTHTLGNHFHAMSHSHDLQSHTHNFQHTHGIPSHFHSVAGHTHYANITLNNASHSHPVPVRATGNVGTNQQPRDGNNTGTANTVGTSSNSHSHTLTGTVGAGGVSGDNVFNTTSDGGTTSDILNSGGGGITNTGGPSTNSTDTFGGNTGGPTNNTSGAPSTNSTASDGAATTGSNNAPYLVLDFIIRAS